MPLSTREVLLVIRAKDQASRTLNGIGAGFTHLDQEARRAAQNQLAAGSALMTLGVGLGALGAIGLQTLSGMRKDAVEYNNTVALTRTQIDKAGVSLQAVGKIGLDVAKKVPVAFEQLQPTLYDIFSSLDVNLPQAQALLMAFSKTAVGGQTDLQTASRATIAELNAFQIPVKDVNHILDLQFQLVRKGVGTYGEFASTVGRAIPAFVASGQRIETMNGALAFLTRRGLSAAMASTSAARAMELVATPKVTRHLEAYGIQVKDSHGNFLQLNDIVTQLAQNKGWATMATPERKKLFQDIFGTGSIQARRFFDTAIPGYKSLNDLTSAMYNSKGAAAEAYRIMFNQPQSQSQLLSNNIKVLRIELGEYLIPVFNKMVRVGLKFTHWFEDLSPKTKKMIVQFTAITSVVFILVGAVTAVVGLFLALSAAGTLLGIGLAPILGIIALVAAAIAGLVYAGYWMVNNWDAVKKKVGPIWDTIRGYVSKFKDKVLEYWRILKEKAIGWAEQAKTAWINVGPVIAKASRSTASKVNDAWKGVKETLSGVPKALADAWNSLYEKSKPIVEKAKKLWNQYWSNVQQVWADFKQFWDKNIQPVWEQLKNDWEDLRSKLQKDLPSIIALFKDLGLAVLAVVYGLALLVGGLLRVVGYILDHVNPVLESFAQGLSGLVDIISGVLQTLLGVVEVFTGIFTLNWSQFSRGISDIWRGSWEAVVGIIKFALVPVTFAMRALGAIVIGALQGIYRQGPGYIIGFVVQAINWFNTLSRNLINIITSLVIRIPVLLGQLAVSGVATMQRFVINLVQVVSGLAQKILGAIQNASTLLFNVGAQIIGGLINGIQSGISRLINLLTHITDLIPKVKGPRAVDMRLLYGSGQIIMQGLVNGIGSQESNLKQALGDVTDLIKLHAGSPDAVMNAMTQGGGSPVVPFGGHGRAGPAHVSANLNFPNVTDSAGVADAVAQGIAMVVDELTGGPPQ
jgi:TP901 family phage tail tape measure protein